MFGSFVFVVILILGQILKQDLGNVWSALQNQLSFILRVAQIIATFFTAIAEEWLVFIALVTILEHFSIGMYLLKLSTETQVELMVSKVEGLDFQMMDCSLNKKTLYQQLMEQLFQLAFCSFSSFCQYQLAVTITAIASTTK